MIGIDQQWRRPAPSARSRIGAHLGSVAMSSVIVSSPDHAADPQVPTFGPMTTPSIAAR